MGSLGTALYRAGVSRGDLRTAKEVIVLVEVNVLKVAICLFFVTSGTNK
jgi:hypothetical protein